MLADSSVAPSIKRHSRTWLPKRIAALTQTQFFLSEEPALAGKCVLLIFSAIPSTQCLSQQICIMHICAQCSVPSAVQVDFFLSAL